MRDREPITRTMKASETRLNWSKVLNQVFRREIRVIVEKSGIPVAAIVSIEDLDGLGELLPRREERFQAVDVARAAFRDIPDRELEAQVDRALQAVRIAPGPHS